MVSSASAAAVVLMRLLVLAPSATTSASTLISRWSSSSSSSSSIGFRPLLYSSNFSSAAATTSVKMSLGDSSSSLYTFGPYQIDPKEVFYSTALSYAMVNLRPFVPDVLVCPRREVKRFVDLTDVETSDLWLTAKKVGGRLECFHKATSLTYAIQDGPQAGQTVPHVHIHILPRKGGDFEKNDEIYDAIDEAEKEMKQKLDLDKERKDRSQEEMAQEADEYRSLFMSVYRESNES